MSKTKNFPQPATPVVGSSTHQFTRNQQMEDRIRCEILNIGERINSIEEKINRFAGAIKEIISALNSVTVVVNCIEKYLDEKASGWDSGVRDEVLKRANALKERDQIIKQINANTDSIENLISAGNRLWELAIELGSEKNDISTVLIPFLRAKDGDGINKIIKSLRGRNIVLSKEIDDLIQQLESRYTESLIIT